MSVSHLDYEKSKINVIAKISTYQKYCKLLSILSPDIT